eukprot:2418681-Rhodomonas_salina.1
MKPHTRTWSAEHSSPEPARTCNHLRMSDAMGDAGLRWVWVRSFCLWVEVVSGTGRMSWELSRARHECVGTGAIADGGGWARGSCGGEQVWWRGASVRTR